MIEFRVLGPLEVTKDGRRLQLGPGRQLAIVAILLLHRNEVVSVDRLVDELWDEAPPATAAKIVRNNVSLLRRELGDRLVTRSPGYLLRVEPGELDSERLERAVADGRPEEIDAALALWRGRPLVDFTYDGFAQGEIARLDELGLVAHELHLDAELARGRHAAAIPGLERLVEQYPLRERPHALLMLALYRAGRQADALEVYRRLRGSLDAELGIEPGRAVRDLERSILVQDASLGGPSIALARVRRVSRNRALALAAAAGAIIAVGAGALAWARDPDVSLRVPPNHVGVIDPSTGAVEAAIPVGIRPGPITVGNGAVWVGNVDDRSLSRIDTRPRATTATVALGRRTPTGLAVETRAVWVAHGRSGELSRVEPRFGETLTVEITRTPYALSYGAVALEPGAVWAVYGDSTLARVDPSDARVVGTTLTGAGSAAVAVGEGAVWVANAGDATVQRFNPATFTEGPVRTIGVGRQPIAIAHGFGAVWVANRADGTVARIDPSTNASVFTIRVGLRPVALAIGVDAVWVANAGDGTVTRIEPETNDVAETITVGGSPAGIAVADGHVWVSVAVAG